MDIGTYLCLIALPALMKPSDNLTWNLTSGLQLCSSFPCTQEVPPWELPGSFFSSYNLVSRQQAWKVQFSEF